MYYQGTVLALRAAIIDQHPAIRSRFSDIDSSKPVPMSYIMWMLEGVEKLDTNSIDDAIAAARWMGWIFREIELAGIWGNDVTRQFVRIDRQHGYDKPHKLR